MRIERWIGVLIVLFMMPVAALAAKATIYGKVLFIADCGTCHGADGRGSDYGSTLKPVPARDLHALARLISRDELRRIITYGVQGTAMTQRTYSLDALEVEAIIDYIKGFDYKPNLVRGKDRFQARCAQCHGSGGRGQTKAGAKNLVYSQLNMQELVYTIRHGREGTAMTGKLHKLSNSEIADVAAYVYALRYMPSPAHGQKLFASNCVSCHATARHIKLMGHSSGYRTIADMDDHVLSLRIRHGRHVAKAGDKVAKLSENDTRDIIAYIRKTAR